jgi:hypothetical protein
MTISVMKGQPDRTPTRRWDPKCHPCPATLLADVCAEEESMNGIIPRVEVEEPGCCSTAEEGRTRLSRRVWRDVRVRICGVGRPGPGPGPGPGQGGQRRLGGGPWCSNSNSSSSSSKGHDLQVEVKPFWLWHGRVQGASLPALVIIDWIAAIPGAIVRCQIGEVTARGMARHGEP